MRSKSFAFFYLLAALLCCSLISCGGDGGGGGASSLPTEQSFLSAQIQNPLNWEIYQGRDAPDVNIFASNKTIGNRVMTALNNVLSIIGGREAVALDLGAITTYSSNGIVANVMHCLYLDDTYLIAGDVESGYSVIRLSDVPSPKGKILNYRGSPSNNAKFYGPYGFQGVSGQKKIRRGTFRLVRQ
jgi:hypothetical protein